MQHLELLDGADITATSIRVAWLAPTRNAHKLLKFKLMVTAEDGGVREVYEVRAQRARAAGPRCLYRGEAEEVER